MSAADHFILSQSEIDELLLLDPALVQATILDRAKSNVDSVCTADDRNLASELAQPTGGTE